MCSLEWKWGSTNKEKNGSITETDPTYQWKMDAIMHPLDPL